jgi:hypothetical protein
MTTIPDQPDGIDPYDPDDHTLPPLADAATRVGEYLSYWGDGLIDVGETPDGKRQAYPLYARDLQVLIDFAEGRQR